jgi:glucose/mannose-6-phosphate isomerase
MNLNSVPDIEKYDVGKVLQSIKELPLQVEQTWKEMKKIEMPEKYKQASRVVICGMGGSALGGRMVDSLFSESVRGPIEVYTGYHVPQYADDKTLVVLSSYSGYTEETIECFYQALEKKSLVFGITTGGKLATLLKKESCPSYIFNPKHNPSNQPRMSLGYSFGTILYLMNRTGFVTITDEEMESTLTTLKKFIKEYGADFPIEENVAKKIADELFGKVPVIIASEHLVGVAHAFKNQLNENAKTFSLLFDIPELNHHLLEGLKNPSRTREILKFIFFESNLYSDGAAKRYPLTREIVEKNGYPYSIYPLRSATKLEQVFEILAFGSLISFYLAYLYQEDTSQIPWVDYLKSKLE